MRKWLWLVGPLAFASPVVAAPATADASPPAQNVQCHSGDILTGVYLNVIVAKNNFCLLLDATVLNNVLADNAIQLGIDNSTIGGGIYVNSNSDSGFICGSTVGGTVEVTNNAVGVGPPPAWVIGDESFCGPPFDTVPGNYIGGNLIFSNNKIEGRISNNDVERNFLCERNALPPSGSNNAVDGTATGQCATLAGGVDDSSSPPDSD